MIGRNRERLQWVDEDAPSTTDEGGMFAMAAWQGSIVNKDNTFEKLEEIERCYRTLGARNTQQLESLNALKQSFLEGDRKEMIAAARKISSLYNSITEAALRHPSLARGIRRKPNRPR